MNVFKILELAERYAKRISERTTPAKAAELANTLKGQKAYTITEATRFRHLLWMLEQMKEFAQEGRTDKAMRWLGFVQGTLWLSGMYDINELYAHNRPPEPIPWTQADDIASKKQGWAVFNADGVNTIQRLDDPEDVAWEIEKVTGAKIKIVLRDSDAEAIEHVKVCAECGSDLHQRALKLHGTPCINEKLGVIS